MNIRLLKLLLIVPMIFGCNKFDDSHLWDSINSLNNRVERLETICDKMNANISSLQTIVQALQTNDGVKSVTSLPNGEGYTINFVPENQLTFTTEEMGLMVQMERTDKMGKME